MSRKFPVRISRLVSRLQPGRAAIYLRLRRKASQIFERGPRSADNISFKMILCAVLASTASRNPAPMLWSAPFGGKIILAAFLIMCNPPEIFFSVIAID